jgi:hypothetical protein
MSDIEDRLADIERRLQRLELTGVRPIDPLQPIQPFAASSTMKNLLFWLGLVVLGVVIWEFSSRLSP